MDEKLKNYYELTKRRKSIREFDEREIPEEVLERLLNVLKNAQSAANRQPWHFIVLKKTGRSREFDEKALHRPEFRTAPIIIAACADKSSAWVRRVDEVNYGWVDVAIAVTEMVTAATAEGLGSCWIAAIDPVKVRELLGIPENIDVVSLIALGYPTAPLVEQPKGRKELSEIIHYGKW